MMNFHIFATESQTQARVFKVGPSSLSACKRCINTKIGDPLKSLSQEQQGVLIGLLLGDGSIRRAKPSHNSRLSFKQSSEKKEYVYHVFNIFKEFCHTGPKERSSIRGDKTNFALGFETLSFPCFNPYRELFYPAGGMEKKSYRQISGISSLSKVRSFRSVDDGCKDGNGLIFCTDSFTHEEILILIDALGSKFGIETSVRNYKKHFRLYVKVKSMDNLKSLVKPHFAASMLYKLGL